MSGAPLPDVAGFGPSAPHSAPHTAEQAPVAGLPAPPQGAAPPGDRSLAQLTALQDQLASWLTDLTALHELTERVARADSLDTVLRELLAAGAGLVGAGRGVAVLRPADGRGPETSVGLGLARCDLGTLETVPPSVPFRGRDGGAGPPEGARAAPLPELIHPDIAADPDLPPRHREVAAGLGIAASYALPLVTEATGPLGSVVWLYDEPAVPSERQRHLAALYCSFAAQLVAKQLHLFRSRREALALREALLPSRLPCVPGVRLGVRHRCGADGGGDWYDALVLPEGALGLSVGGVTGTGPAAAAAMGRLRTSLRAYAVMEGEDPVAVLSDLELLLHMTEPARSATALFVHTEPARRRLVLAGAGHCPPLLVGEGRTELVETSLSAPLGMLGCWEAPSAELSVEPGETLVLYTDGLLHHSGGTLDQAFARLRGAGAHAPRAAREDPGLLCDHLLASCLSEEAAEQADSSEDIVMLAVRFD
ncbi:PP2C family protein-serine/threonine phosphatase [Streptomyces capparidis]